MTPDPNLVAATETGHVRLFTTELDPAEASNITAKNVQRLLGKNVQLDTTKVEVITSKSLEGLGLRRYLIDGYGIDEASLQGKAAALDALKGLIVLVPSSAFQGRAQELDPNPAFRFIGMFREQTADAPKVMLPKPPTDGSVSSTQKTFTQTGHARSWVGALGALLIAAALVIWIVL